MSSKIKYFLRITLESILRGIIIGIVVLIVLKIRSA